jgi:hypothetical protein
VFGFRKFDLQRLFGQLIKPNKLNKLKNRKPMKQISFLAFDLGATSGRTILGTLNEGKLQMKELTRFPNQILELNGHAYWNIFSLYEHLKAGMIAAAKEDVDITSIGIDTWGVDFVFLGEDGQILGIPHAYRDQHTAGAPEEYFEKVLPRKEVYDITGIQIMNFNSLYQLYAMKRDNSSLLNAAKEALFIPDALSYMLTGKKVVEYTIASTSQILNPCTKKFETCLLEKMGVKPDLFGDIVMPGYVIGTLTDALAAETGLGKLPVVAVAGHRGCRSGQKRKIRLPELRYLVVDGYRSQRSDHHGRNFAPEHHQRRRRRRHYPPAEEYHRHVDSRTVHQRVAQGSDRIHLPRNRQNGARRRSVPVVHRPGRRIVRQSSQHDQGDQGLLS